MPNPQTEQIAKRLVALCREGKFSQAQDELYADDARSVEMDTMTIDATWKGRGRHAMEEICVYETANGKVVREQFFYAT